MNPSCILKKVYTSQIPQLLAPHKCISQTVCLCKQIQFDYSIQQTDSDNDQCIQVQVQVQVQDEDQKQLHSKSTHQLDNKMKVCSHNPILLYALALFLYGDISRPVYNQIQAGSISVRSGTCGEGGQEDGVREFLGRLCLRQLLSIKYDWQATLLLDFINNECENKDIKMIMRIEQDQQHTTVKKQENAGTFIIAYQPTEQCQALLQTYRFVSQPIDNEIMLRKLQFLKLTNKKTSNNLYGLIEKGCVNCRVVQCGEQGKDQSIENSVITDQSFQSVTEKVQKNSQSKINQSQISLSLKFQYFVVFGLNKYVTRFCNRFLLEINNIGYVQFKNNDPFYLAPLFNVIQALASRYSKLKVYSINNGQLLQVYYHTSIKAIFDQAVMNYKQYRTLTLTSSIKSILKQSPFNSLKDKYPDLLLYPKEQSEQIIGPKQLLDKIESTQKERKQRKRGQKSQKKQSKQLQITPLKNEQQEIQKFVNTNTNTNTNKVELQLKLKSPVKQVDKKNILEFMSNLEINQHNVADIFVMTDNFKMQEFMSYKIDVGEHVRIVNRVKKCPIVYVAFDGGADLVSLLSIVEQDIDLQQINRILHEYQDQLCHKQKQIKTTNNETTLKLQPISEQSDMNEILQKIKKDPQLFVRTLICSLSTLHRILQQCTISFNIVFAVNQSVPNFQMDFCFDKHTYAMRVKINKMHGQYHSLIKCEVANQDYKDAGNLRKQETKLKEMLKKNDHEFEIADFVLSQLDEYNICYMISQGQKGMFFALSKRPTQEFIYLTYHQKLLKILRDKKGYFDKLQQASMRDLNKNTEAMLKPVIIRAFLTGQKYISINLPFQHIKQVKMEDITFLPTGNSNLISFYTNKINQSERYKVLIKAPYTAEYVQKKFAKHYTLKFENQKLRKQIKLLDLGYGGVKKWRQRPFICLRAEWQVCEKVLHKFAVEREAERNQNRRKY